MMARLGAVLYGLGCLIALVCIVGGAFMAYADAQHAGVVFGIMAGFGVAALVLGRVFRYVLAGE